MMTSGLNMTSDEEDLFAYPSMLEKFDQFRKEKLFFDFTLELDDPPYQCQVHKIVLAASSEFFKLMFCSKSSEEAKTNRAKINQIIGTSTLLDIIDFCYTGHIKVEISNVQKLLEAASFLQIESLLRVIANLVKKNVDDTNCLGVLDVGTRFNLKDLKDLALAYCLQEFEQVCNNDEFIEVDGEALTQIVQHDALAVSDETLVLNSILRWVKADPTKRTPLMRGLLSHVRFALLKPSSLVELSEDPSIREVEDCRALLELAKDYLLIKNETNILDSEKYRGFLINQRVPENMNQRIYALGGWTNDYRPTTDVEIYNPFDDTWTRAPSMKVARCGVGAAIIGDYLYAVGGHDGSHYLNSMERFNMKTKVWEDNLEPMFVGRTSVGVVALDGFLYTIGGQSVDEPVSNVERYNPEKNTWEHLAPMNEKRLGAGVTVAHGKIYVIGGYKEPGQILRTSEVYDPKSNCWSRVEPLNQARKHLGCTTLRGYIYAVGGRGEPEIGELGTVEKLDPLVRDIEGGGWEQVESLKMPRSGIGLVSLDGMMYAIGGHNGDMRLNVVEMYNPEINEWVPKSPMNRERLGGGFALYSKKFCKHGTE